uniref:Kinetochore protein NDC80 n=1 Tax=Chromera velia CCMP2878 TaxID=1169474 RepID=A0A0G4FDL1_9ALVE|eukprot:Cvel_16391.t1-p1 / transcript=Cvel_16391.t1 / gene=Cvel_16391 / organism=Chromera_velia_CCMP2878 / gene_product=Kinetochore protein ndc80, putative / transcript_product=Kinetochore protein ndc80, putative / location=Cvel_scaffold1261:25021-33790(+) / protein_length=733 / sequence_SO=supercontig / SO=protein_coding / is_pseudo=false
MESPLMLHRNVTHTANLRFVTMGVGNRKDKDPRPLANAGWQSRAITSLVDFLVNHDFPHQINQNSLKRPTRTVFMVVAKHLISLYDPAWHWSDKPDEDVAQFFKMAGYPYEIHKSKIAAVGAPNTWPHLLGALSWLVDLLQYGESVGITAQLAEKSGLSLISSVPEYDEKAILARTLREDAIETWDLLERGIESSPEHDRKLTNYLKSHVRSQQLNIEYVRQEREECENDIAEFERKCRQASEEQREHSKVRKEYEEMKRREEERLRDARGPLAERSALQERVVRLSKERDAKRRECESLRERVNSQPMSREDFESTRRGIEKTREVLAQREAELAEVDRDAAAEREVIRDIGFELDAIAREVRAADDELVQTAQSSKGFIDKPEAHPRHLLDCPARICRDLEGGAEDAETEGLGEGDVNSVLGFRWKDQVKPLLKDADLLVFTKHRENLKIHEELQSDRLQLEREEQALTYEKDRLARRVAETQAEREREETEAAQEIEKNFAEAEAREAALERDIAEEEGKVQDLKEQEKVEMRTLRKAQEDGEAARATAQSRVNAMSDGLAQLRQEERQRFKAATEAARAVREKLRSSFEENLVPLLENLSARVADLAERAGVNLDSDSSMQEADEGAAAEREGHDAGRDSAQVSSGPSGDSPDCDMGCEQSASASASSSSARPENSGETEGDGANGCCFFFEVPVDDDVGVKGGTTEEVTEGQVCAEEGEEEQTGDCLV